MTDPVVPSTASERLPAVTGVTAALLAASCCILPIVLISLGVVGAGFMMTMMRYEWFTLPLGVAGLVAAYVVYFRSRRQCQTAGCQFIGKRFNQALLAIATIIVAIAIVLRIFPSWTAAILQRL